MHETIRRPHPPYGIIAALAFFLAGDLLLLFRMAFDVLF